MKFIVFFRILVIAALGSLLQAEEGKVLDHELSEWKLGKTLFGQDVIPAKLNGKVVVLGYWGAKCSSCLEGMSQLADLDKKYRGEGLRVIGAETHRSDKKKVRQVVVSQKLKFSITAGVKGPISILGLPHVVVFGSDGKLLFSGHPNRKEFEKTVKLAVTEVKNSRKAGVIVEKSRGKASNALGSENR